MWYSLVLYCNHGVGYCFEQILPNAEPLCFAFVSLSILITLPAAALSSLLKLLLVLRPSFVYFSLMRFFP